jgi:hypothetical protein
MFTVGNTISFEYNGKLRHVKIEEIKVDWLFQGLRMVSVPKLVTGWDYLADLSTGGFRSFKVDKMENVVVV